MVKEQNYRYSHSPFRSPKFSVFRFHLSVLLERAHLKHVHLVLGEETPIATLHVLFGKTGKVDTVQFHHLVAQVFEDTAHYTVAATMYLYAHLFLVHRISIVNGIGMYLAILQHNALGNLTKVGSGNVLVAIYVVNLLLEILGVCQLGSQIAIVGEQEHTSGAAVQTTYGIYALAASVLHQVHYGLAILWVIAGGNIVLGLVQQQIDAAISEVKAKNYPENHSVLFINDAYIANQPILSHKGGNLELYAETKPCAEIGSYATFGANVAPEYTYSLQGNDVTMQGTGGVGFAIFNLKGEIICFSDKMTFTMSESCAKLLASGNATIVGGMTKKLDIDDILKGGGTTLSKAQPAIAAHHSNLFASLKDPDSPDSEESRRRSDAIIGAINNISLVLNLNIALKDLI